MNLPSRQRGGIFVRVFFLVLVPLAGGAAGLYWYALGGRYVVTDNAYVKAHMVAISASIDGRVSEVAVVDNRPVAEGEVLFTLDARPYEIARTRAEAHMAAVRNELASQRAAFAQVAAEIADARERVQYLRGEQSRQEALAEGGAANATAIDTLRYESDAALKALQALHEKAGRVLAEIGDLEAPITENPDTSRQGRPGRRRSSRWSTPRCALPPAESRAGCSFSPANGWTRGARSSVSSIRASSGLRRI